MNTHVIKRKRWTTKTIALLVTVSMVAAALAINIGATLAAPEDISVTLQCESGINANNTFAVGETKSLTSSYLFEAYSTNPGIATVSFTRGSSMDNVRTTGVKAGVVGVSWGTERGTINTALYQITDSNNISAYSIKDGGEVYFASVGVTKASPVNVTAGSFSRIAWESMNEDVAVIGSNGRITSTGYGATIVAGSFIDKWGVPRTMNLLIGVGVKLSGSDLGDLLELIKKGEEILADNPGQYTTDSLHDLQDAVNDGKSTVNKTNPTEQEIKDAVKDLIDAIAGMEKKPTQPSNVIGPDNGGNYYKPAGDPENIFEVVDKDGNSKNPPQWVYNPSGDPVGKPDKNTPTYPKDGSYYVEDPEGSNIYHKVKGDGTLQDSPAIWGGGDGKLGGSDDQPVYKFGDDYWIDLGQNVWQKVNKNSPTQLDPTLIGGGTDYNPATDPVTPIYKYGNKYFVGPLPPGTSDGYYYGDKQSGGNGYLESSPTYLDPTDERYYLVNGNMVPESQLPGIPGLEDKPIGGIIVIDGMEWIKVKVDPKGQYAMLLLNSLIPNDPVRYHHNKSNNIQYQSAEIKGRVDGWYDTVNAPTLKKFAWPVSIGTDNNESWPQSIVMPSNNTYAFIPKQAEIDTYIFNAQKRAMGELYWTSTPTTVGDMVGYNVIVREDGTFGARELDRTAYIRPAIWVQIK